MAQVIIYEKPGCINNTKQKAWMSAAGHDVAAVNILETEWTPERLRPFFGDRPVKDWFNTTAPQVKSGDVNPDSFSEVQALEIMVKDPILIKRPLLRVGNERMQGFDKDAIDAWIGLKAAPGNEDVVDTLLADNLTLCPMLAKNTSCDEQAAQIPEKPLALIMEICGAASLEVTYEWDDLVFVSHNIIIFRFTDIPREVDLFFNKDCEADAEKDLSDKLIKAAVEKGIILTQRGHYELSEAQGENISIEFFETH